MREIFTNYASSVSSPLIKFMYVFIVNAVGSTDGAFYLAAVASFGAVNAPQAIVAFGKASF